ncbi:phosphoribosyltransferase [Candidatus Pandoraea novymonadis]|uniref:Xanthine phosphoribosyltransferase n=1 Tax=Candidatus Pandoraea novymonadis TaxID=1808959 RepID=A0ABX5FFJ5_9BURK|nr:phosphoribosyltransferase family protein [Candidatus Pandoraea novymonadis]PSB91942.1 Xanthine phosphoribosyltransferase [Candidatus Pandoraea novymonadis]
MNLSKKDDDNLWISWDEYHRMIEYLAFIIYESQWKFDQILCLARGGLRVGDHLSRIYGLPLAILATSSYHDSTGMVRSDLDIAQHITITRGALKGRVLLVDDLVDSGVTIQRVLFHLKDRFPEVTEIRSAVLWCKSRSILVPDYYVKFLLMNPWIHQPFEYYDALSPENLSILIRRSK